MFDAPGLHDALNLTVEIVRAAVRLALVIAIFAPLERLFPVVRARTPWRDWAVNAGWHFTNSLAAGLILALPALALAKLSHLLIPQAALETVAGLPLWVRMVAAMAVGEVGFYWGHRWSHEIPWLWRFHAVHHSPTAMNFLVNARAHPVDFVFTRLCGMVPLYVLGLANTAGPHPDLIPALVLFVGSLWSFFIHANVRWRLGWLEEVIASPAFHHWHHTFEDHKDRNYASMLPVMDRLFGTFWLPREWPQAYGTATPVAGSWSGQLLDPLIDSFSRPKPAPDRPAE